MPSPIHCQVLQLPGTYFAPDQLECPEQEMLLAKSLLPRPLLKKPRLPVSRELASRDYQSNLFA
jgi:hypothetical protein